VARPESVPDLDGVRAFCREKGLMRQKLPERLVLVTALPRNPMGKVVKERVRDALRMTRTR
jgi:non-ribosomal peptide synthetase component E (peptide arylation enzyme)